jgi:hypothetical protein
MIRNLVTYEKARWMGGDDPNQQTLYKQKYNRALFHMTAAIASQLVNCFIGFITGTSEKSLSDPYEDFWSKMWQRRVLGGVITRDKDDMDRLVSVNLEGENGRHLSQNAIDQALRGGKIPDAPGLWLCAVVIC